MQYKKLGRTGLYVSRLCLGTMNFGDCTDKKSAFEIMDRAAELGINFIDTADVYGGPQRPDIPLGYGISEEIVGECADLFYHTLVLLANAGVKLSDVCTELKNRH